MFWIVFGSETDFSSYGFRLREEGNVTAFIVLNLLSALWTWAGWGVAGPLGRFFHIYLLGITGSVAACLAIPIALNLVALRDLRRQGWTMLGYMDAACARRYLGNRLHRLPPYEHAATALIMDDGEFQESFWRLMEFVKHYWVERDQQRQREAFEWVA